MGDANYLNIGSTKPDDETVEIFKDSIPEIIKLIGDKFKHHKTDQAHQYSLGISLLISCIFTVGATVLEEEGDQQKFTQSIYTAFKRGFEKINKEKNKKDE
jgi:hypothetical protein